MSTQRTRRPAKYPGSVMSMYSLGEVLHEIVCGRDHPSCMAQAAVRTISSRGFLECDSRDRILDAADEELKGQFDQQMEAVLRLGLQCVLQDRHNRPHIGRVRDRLTKLLANRNGRTYQQPRVTKGSSVCAEPHSIRTHGPAKNGCDSE